MMFEHVIRNPFDMKPVFNPCKKPSFNVNETDIVIQSQKRIELDNLGTNIWFETPTVLGWPPSARLRRVPVRGARATCASPTFAGLGH